MSYTLRGRLETRLAAALLPFVFACMFAAVLGEWWPIQLAAVMIAVGLVLDAAIYHRLLPYQPGWAAMPLGLVELGATMALVFRLDVEAPLGPALGFFAASWLLAQVLGHAGFPLLRLSYGDDGGELGRGGRALSLAAPVAALALLGVAWIAQPPTVRISGTVEGPLVLDHAQTLVGEPGAVVRGGIVITADDVTVRDVKVFGGEIGIEVLESEDVVLDGVRIAGTTMDGINARQSSLLIRDCRIELPEVAGPQGIDISFASSLPPSTVQRCEVTGGSEGIVSHMAMVMISENRVTGARMRGIAVTEMSMGEIDRNVVEDSVGVGIYCGDYSHCEIDENSVSGTRRDASGNPARAGFGIVSHYGATATLDNNQLDRGAAAFTGGKLERG
ncbi:MAG: right-handed parallel beta-helix repeat-containing protein [Gaiellaceae bacterium MAG52_C11]|nr:right-handed parallel beta-helix repeat-containing protein [Candidatus Gaiellasilicea maunaloa]